MSRRDPGRAYRRRANGEAAPQRQWQRYKRPGTDAVEREYGDLGGDPVQSRAAAPARRPRGWPWVAGLGAFVVVGTGGALLANGTITLSGEAAPEPYPREERHSPLLDQARLDRVTEQLQKATGSTQVIDFWVESDGRMRLQVPPKKQGELANEYQWEDGTLELTSASKAGEHLPFDLTSVDPAALVRTDEEARRRSDGEISNSLARVQHPSYGGDHWVYQRVSEIDHGAVVLWTDLAGKVEDDLSYADWRSD